MGNLTAPFGLWFVWGFWLYLLSLIGVRFYYLVYDESKVPADFVSNLMRIRPLGALGGLAVLMGALILFSVVGVFKKDDPWTGMGEYAISLVIYSTYYSLEMWKRQSVDAGWLVGFSFFVGGLIWGIPMKLILFLIKVHHDKWSSGLVLLAFYVIGMGYYSVKFVKKRADQEEAGIVIKSKALDEFMAHSCYILRVSFGGGLMLFLVWIFQVEEFLEINEVGYAFISFYYVVALYILIGCCRVFRVNDF